MLSTTPHNGTIRIKANGDRWGQTYCPVLELCHMLNTYSFGKYVLKELLGTNEYFEIYRAILLGSSPAGHPFILLTLLPDKANDSNIVHEFSTAARTSVFLQPLKNWPLFEHGQIDNVLFHAYGPLEKEDFIEITQILFLGAAAKRSPVKNSTMSYTVRPELEEITRSWAEPTIPPPNTIASKSEGSRPQVLV